MEVLPSLAGSRLGRLVAGVTVGLAVLIGGLGVSAVSTVGSFPTSAIADYAVAHFPAGSRGGQCIIFAERVVDATFAKYGLPHHFPGAAGPEGYYTAYADAGGQLVAEAGPGGYVAALAAALRGDVIQLSPLSPMTSPTPWTDPGDGHQHTAILLGAEGARGEVIDSNWNLDLRVRSHALADVIADAAHWRLEMAIWAFGLSNG
jgi:hypothetical protein